MSARPDIGSSKAAGFSLIELIIAMAITLVIMTAACTLLAGSLGVRVREDRRSDALEDAQRALNIMTRELANTALGLPDPLTYTPASGTPTTVPGNGLLPGYSDGDNIAFVSNLNSFDGDEDLSDTDEALYYTYYFDADADRSFLVRKDMNTDDTLVLSNRVDALQLVYVNRDPLTGTLSDGVADSAPTANTVGVKITVSVQLPEVGTPGSPGYHPASQSQLSSEVVLRNAVISTY